ncbi:MAG TPA: class F sortase [Nocardioidaceae bacterium]
MRTTRPVAAAVALLAVIGLVVSAIALWPRPDQAAPPPTATPAPQTVSPSAPAAPAPTPSQVARSDARLPGGATQQVPRPARVVIASADIDARVRPVGVAEDGQMELPDNPRVMGWYRFGPAPGEPGSAVLAGHLDSRRFGLGPLARLRNVEVGDPLEVLQSDGTTASYRVRTVERFDRQGLPDAIFARSGPEVVRVVTCGGEYLPDAGGYQENLVVTAVPVG